MKYSTLLITTFAVALAACTGDVPDTGAEADASVAKEERNMDIDPQLEAYASQAASDLARRLDTDETEVTVIDAAFVTWPNSALGCPEPDMMYTQALVPGYRIRLRAAGEVHHYHGAGDKAPRHCPADRVREPAAGRNNPKDVT